MERQNHVISFIRGDTGSFGLAVAKSELQGVVLHGKILPIRMMSVGKFFV
jgi:hypothetical protein